MLKLRIFIGIFIYWGTLFQSVSAIDFLLSAPNSFRFGVEETVGIGIAGIPNNSPVSVRVALKDYPGKKHEFSSQIVNVASGTPQIVKVKVHPHDILELQRNDHRISVYLTLTVASTGYYKEVKIPITKYSGYAIIQTDKPLYLPNQIVNIRVMRLTEQMTPCSEKFAVHIKNPSGTIVYNDPEKFPDPSGITEITFQISSVPAFGNWSIQVLYGYQFSAKTLVRFEVKEYVLPTFSVLIEPPDVILNSHEQIEGKIKSNYVYGRPVDGFANVNFAIRTPKGVMIPIGSFKFLRLVSGEIPFKLNVQQDIKAKGLLWFPEIEGSNFVVTAEVVERATGNRETAVNDDALFTRSPYVINLSNSLKNFKPQVPYQLQVEILYSTKKPVTKNVQIHISQAIAYTAKRTQRVMESLIPLETDRYGRLMFQFNTAAADDELEITVKTNDRELSEDNQATAKIKVFKYKSPVSSYVWISTPSEGTIFRVGMQFSTIITVHPTTTQDKLFYMVISKGNIMNMNETQATGGAVLSIQFPVTAEMVPSFRLIVFIIKSGFIVSDSIKIDVEKTCKYNSGEVFSISADTPSGIFNPGDNVKFMIRGEYDSYVGITAVDEAVYLLNKRDLLTKAKMYNEMEKHDFGIGPGGGINPAEVFRNAGLVMLTNANIAEHGRDAGVGQNMKNKRTKRSLKDKIDEYVGKAATCCKFGIMQGPQNMTCEERAQKIEESIGERFNCSAAFLDCCLAAMDKRFAFNQNARSSITGEEEYDPSMSDVDELISNMEESILKNVRSYFPETWISKTFKVGSGECRGENGSACVFTYIAPHSITTWQVQAFAVSKTTGMCVANPFRVPVFKQMFLQLYLPPVAVRGEQIEVMATVYNYGQRDLEVTIYTFGVKGICMGAGPGERSATRKILVNANNASSVAFLIMPLFVGEYPIRVVAASWHGSDAIEKKLKVVHEGVRKVKPLTLTLDPSEYIPNRKKRSPDSFVYSVAENTDKEHKKQNIQVTIDLPSEAIPDTETCSVSVIGDSMGQVVNVTFNGLDAFVILPSGCGEQNAAKLAPLIYTMSYLRKSGKMTTKIESEGYKHMWSGYSSQLKYRKNDGSFAVYPNHESGLWLTAFVAKIFCQAEQLIAIEHNDMCGAIDWLAKQQRNDGSFADRVAVRYVGTGDLNGTVPLTAFTLISMLECENCIRERQQTVNKAKTYLENNIPVTVGHLSIVTYALGLAKSTKFAEALDRLKAMATDNEYDDTRHWRTRPPQSINAQSWIYRLTTASTIEITSYALLAVLVTDDLEYAHPIARWLNNQRSSGGFFISTQDTVVALQALATYNIKTKFPPVQMNCEVSTSASRKKRNLYLNRETSMVLQEIEMPAKGVVHVVANGTGVATMSVLLAYFSQPSNDDRNCNFDLVIDATEKTETVLPIVPTPEHNEQTIIPEAVVRNIFSDEEVRNQFGYKIEEDECTDCDDDIEQVEHKKIDVVKLNVCVRHHNSEREAAMSILDIGLFTGYRPIEDDIKNLTNHSESSYVDNYEISDRSVVLYLSKVPNQALMCISFRAVKEFHVGKTQPAMVKVYEYYEPGKSCTKFYTADKSSPLLEKICEGKTCFCLEGMCPSCKPFMTIRNIEKESDRRTALLNLICDSHDFAWKAKLMNEKIEGSFKLYEFHISRVLKEGRQRVTELEDQTVIFWSRNACQCPSVTIGEDYIIMSNDGQTTLDKDGDIIFHYYFDKETRIYHDQLLANIKDRKGQNLQKTVNSIYRRLVERREGCLH